MRCIPHPSLDEPKRPLEVLPHSLDRLVHVPRDQRGQHFVV
jgi:hypothetical protein